MTNIEYLKIHLSKHPHILKRVVSFEDLLNTPFYQIKHFITLYSLKQNKYKYINLAIHDYQTFRQLYKTLIAITKTDEGFNSLSFCDLTMQEKEDFLNIHNIKYENFDEHLIAYPTTFEETKLIGSPQWCISKQQKFWTMYNKDRNHIILYKDDSVVGISHRNGSTESYDYDNKSISIPISIKSHLNLETYNQKVDMQENCYSFLIFYILYLIPNINILAAIFSFFLVFFMANGLKEKLTFAFICIGSLFLSSLFNPIFNRNDVIGSFLIPYTETQVTLYNIFSPLSEDDLDNKKGYSALILDDTTILKSIIEEKQSTIDIKEKSLEFIIANKRYKILSYILENHKDFSFSLTHLLSAIEKNNDLLAFNLMLNFYKGTETVVISYSYWFKFKDLLSNDDNKILSAILSLNTGVSMIDHRAITIGLESNNIEGVLMLINSGYLDHVGQSRTSRYFSNLLISAITAKEPIIIKKIHLKMKDLGFKPNLKAVHHSIFQKNIYLINAIDLDSYKIDDNHKILLEQFNEEPHGSI